MSCRRCATRRRRCRQTGPAKVLPLPTGDTPEPLAHRPACRRESGQRCISPEPQTTVRRAAHGPAPAHTRAENNCHSPGTPFSVGVPRGLERDSRARDEVAHRARHEDLAAGGVVSHTSADVYGEAADVVATHLTLARVQPGAHIEAERPAGLTDGVGAADGARGTVEGRQQAVAGGLGLAAAEAVDLRSFSHPTRTTGSRAATPA